MIRETIPSASIHKIVYEVLKDCHSRGTLSTKYCNIETYVNVLTSIPDETDMSFYPLIPMSIWSFKKAIDDKKFVYKDVKGSELLTFSVSSEMMCKRLNGHHGCWSEMQKSLINSNIISLVKDRSYNSSNTHARIYQFTDDFIDMMIEKMKEVDFASLINSDLYIKTNILNTRGNYLSDDEIDRIMQEEDDGRYKDLPVPFKMNLAEAKMEMWMSRIVPFGGKSTNSKAIDDIVTFDDSEQNYKKTEKFGRLYSYISFFSGVRFVKDKGPNRRIYSSFTNLPHEFRDILGMRYNGRLVQLKEIDLRATFPTMLANLLYRVNPSDRNIVKFYNKMTQKNYDLYNEMMKKVDESGMTLKMFDKDAGYVREYENNRSVMKKFVQKLIFNASNKTNPIETFFEAEYPVVDGFLKLFRFTEAQAEKAQQTLNVLKSRKWKKFGQLFPWVIDYLERYETIDIEERMKGSTIMSRMLEQLETEIFKYVFESDWSGYLGILHDSLWFPDGMKKEVFAAIEKRMRELGYKQMVFHYAPIPTGEMTVVIKT